jgi:hypothetical protein
MSVMKKNKWGTVELNVHFVMETSYLIKGIIFFVTLQ